MGAIRLLLFFILLTSLLACGGGDDTSAPGVRIENSGPNPCFPQLTAIIIPDSIQSPIVSTIWDGPDSLSSDQLSIEAKIVGTYSFTVIVESGESTMESIVISESDIVSTPPTVTIEDQGLNTDLDLVLEAIGTPGTGDITSYSWSTMDVSSTLIVNEVGIYTVTLEDACGLTVMASQEVTALDLCPYEDEWTALSWNAAISISVNNVTSVSKVTGANINYDLTLEFPNWTTIGDYDALIEANGQNLTQEVRGLTGAGTYVIEDDVLTSDGSFFEYESGMTTTSSEMWSADLSINAQGQLVMNQKRSEEGMTNGEVVVIVIEAASVWERR